MSSATPSPYFFPAMILVEVDRGFICPKKVLPELCWLFYMSFSKSNLAFLFLRLMSGLHCAVNPLYSLPCSLVFMIDLDIDMPTSLRVFTCLAVVKGFLFTREMIVRSSTTVVFPGRPGAIFIKCLRVPFYMQVRRICEM